MPGIESDCGDLEKIITRKYTKDITIIAASTLLKAYFLDITKTLNIDVNAIANSKIVSG